MSSPWTLRSPVRLGSPAGRRVSGADSRTAPWGRPRATAGHVLAPAGRGTGASTAGGRPRRGPPPWRRTGRDRGFRRRRAAVSSPSVGERRRPATAARARARRSRAGAGSGVRSATIENCTAARARVAARVRRGPGGDGHRHGACGRGRARRHVASRCSPAAPTRCFQGYRPDPC